MQGVLGPGGKARTGAFYVSMVIASAVLFLVIRRFGIELRPPHADVAAHAAKPPLQVKGDVLAQVLFALAVVTFAARLVGGLLHRYLGQPAVIGEILAGLMLGPSLLGGLFPGLSHVLLPPEATPHIGMIAKIAVVLFMFMIGMETDMRLLRQSTHATLAISHSSILVPFLLGSGFALALYPRYASGEIGFTPFALFLGVSMSITAFPVLARILTEKSALGTPLGVTALSCAAVDDVTAWILLAGVMSLVAPSEHGVAMTLLELAAFVAFMLIAVRPLLARLSQKLERESKEPTRSQLASIFVGVMLSACATEFIGIHALFGAFLFGASLPHRGRLAERLKLVLGDVVVVFFLPSFFAFTGLRTQVGLLTSPVDVAMCLGILLVAICGKFGGTLLGARVVRVPWREASALGILMNTRGLVELIVLNLGLDIGVITPKVFTMLVIMAVVTTFMTTPILDRILGRRGFEPLPDATPA